MSCFGQKKDSQGFLGASCFQKTFFMWSPNGNLGCYFSSLRRKKSLRFNKKIWLSLLCKKLERRRRLGRAQEMQQDWCEFGMRNIARCYEKCRREWPVALPSPPWEWGEKDGVLGLGMNVPLALVGFENSPVWGLNWYFVSTSFWDAETTWTRKPWALHHLGRALVEVQVEE